RRRTRTASALVLIQRIQTRSPQQFCTDLLVERFPLEPELIGVRGTLEEPDRYLEAARATAPAAIVAAACVAAERGLQELVDIECQFARAHATDDHLAISLAQQDPVDDGGVN